MARTKGTAKVKNNRPLWNISRAFYPLFWVVERYLILCGGRGSGKSEFAARKIVLRCQKEGNHRVLILRKVRSRLRESVLEVVMRVLSDMGQPFEYNKTDRVLTFFSSEGKKNEILFDGLDDPEKIKSIKGLTMIWIEEATEFTERDFTTVDLCLREPGPAYHQVILSFNPEEAEAAWLKERFFDQVDPKAFVHHSTIMDNPIKEVRDLYLPLLDELKVKDETLYAIYRLGLWAVPKGKIYNWPGADLPDIKFDEVFYGGDFGFSIDPAVVVRVYRKADQFWVKELIYERGLTNAMLGARMRAEGIGPRDVVYFDSSEPKSIQEIYEMGFNVKPADKGPDSVRAGIDFLISQNISIVTGSPKIVEEHRTYKWREDKNGKVLRGEPVKFNDHAMDAIRYAIFTHCRATPKAAVAVVSRSVYPD